MLQNWHFNVKNIDNSNFKKISTQPGKHISFGSQPVVSRIPGSLTDFTSISTKRNQNDRLDILPDLR